MKKPKAILFDMGDTLIHQYGSDFMKGTRKLMTFANNPNNVSAQVVQDRATNFTKELSTLQEQHHHDYSCRSFQKYLFESFGLEMKISPDEQEIIFNRTAFDREVVKDLDVLLDLLKKQEIRVAILSNTTFSENTLRDELSLYNLQHTFEFVMATSEYTIRKPDKRIFEVALTKLNLNKEDVWYVGNSFKYDVIGANNAGIYPIWFNHEQKEPLTACSYTEIKNYQELIKLIK